MIDKLNFHHFGVACKNIDNEFKHFEKLGYKPASAKFFDKEQRINGLFIEAKGQPFLELLENSEENGPLNSYLSKGIKFYHMAYETENIEIVLPELLSNGAFIIKPIVNAVYFKRVCFLMLKNMMLIELVELS